MAGRWDAEKRAVVDAARRMVELRLTTGSSGSVSVRLATDEASQLLAVTPLGKPHRELADEDVVVADFDLDPVEGDLAPSSESLLHVAIYRSRPDVGAVVHTHAAYSTVAAVAGLEIPPLVDEMVVHVGGPIRVSEYAFPGTRELADNVSTALGPRNAALIRNHGAVWVGRDLWEAVDIAALVERVAQVFVFTSALGKAHSLPPEVVQAEVALFDMRREASGNEASP